MHEVVFRPKAVMDIDGILVYLSVQVGNLDAAEKLAAAFQDAFDSIAKMPTIGRAFADEALTRQYRRFMVQNYWIYYTFDADTITIWRIFHTSRETNDYGFQIFDD